MKRIALPLLLCLAACGDNGGEEPTITPLLPADYAATYQEVRNCRRSGDHDLNYIRILADPASVNAYRNRDASFAEGALVVKEEYDMGDETCTGPIFQWTIMQRLAPGGGAETLGWKWQKINSAKKVVTENEQRCFSCHRFCGEPPEGYQGTCAVP